MVNYEAKVQIPRYESLRALAGCLGGSNGSLCCRFLCLALDDFVGCPSYSLWWNMSVCFEVGLRSAAVGLLRGLLGHVGSRF